MASALKKGSHTKHNKQDKRRSTARQSILRTTGHSAIKPLTSDDIVVKHVSLMMGLLALPDLRTRWLLSNGKVEMALKFFIGSAWEKNQ